MQSDGTKGFLRAGVLTAIVLGSGPFVRAQGYYDSWFANIAGAASGTGGGGVLDYTGMYVGSDGLPYTSDDVDLTSAPVYFGRPERVLGYVGNPGGKWAGAVVYHSDPSASHFDFDRPFSDREFHFYPLEDPTPPIPQCMFCTNQSEMGTGGRLWDGRVQENEFWSAWWAVGINAEDLNENGTYDGAVGGPFDRVHRNEFDWHVTNFPEWDDESNTGMYNNARANQHGRNKPRYWFSIDNLDARNDEHRRFVFGVANFNQWDRDDLAGGTRRAWHTNAGVSDVGQPHAWWRGFIIPRDELATLADGELGGKALWDEYLPYHNYPTDPGWDLAAYLRDVIEPRLSDPNVYAPMDSSIAPMHDIDNLKLVMVSFFNGPLIQSAWREAEAAVSMDALGIRCDVPNFDVATFTTIEVSDDRLDPLKPAIQFEPKYGVVFNAVAHENFQVVDGSQGVDWNGDGELKNGIVDGWDNAWDRLDENVGNSEDEAVARLSRATSQSQTYLGVGGRRKDINGLSCAPDGIPADTDRVWCLEDGSAYAEAVVRLENDDPDGGNDVVLHLTLERDNAPVAWAIIMDGKPPLLGVGGAAIADDTCGDMYGGVDCATTVCQGNDMSLPAVLDADGVNEDYTGYLLCINDIRKAVRLYMNAGDGSDNLLASYDYGGTACGAPGALAGYVDGMRVFTTGAISYGVGTPVTCSETEPGNTALDALADNGVIERLQVDLITWGYDWCPRPELVSVCPELEAPDEDSYVWPASPTVGDAAGGLTRVGIQLSTNVTQVGSCVTTQSGGGPTSALLTPSGGYGRYHVDLDAPIPLAEWTTVRLTVQPDPNSCGPDVEICFHLGWMPGDVNGDGQLGLGDATAFGYQFNHGAYPARLKRADLDLNGQVGITDAVMFGNIWHGRDGQEDPRDGFGWLGKGLGPTPDCACP